MSEALVEEVWGDGRQRFVLHIGQLRELQDKCNAGPQRILSRLAGIDWLIDDVRETIRLGLIGGGKPPSEAHRLVFQYIDSRDGEWLESRQIATAILMKALVGDPNDEVGKDQAETAKTDPTDGSPSPLSTDGEPS